MAAVSVFIFFVVLTLEESICCCFDKLFSWSSSQVGDRAAFTEQITFVLDSALYSLSSNHGSCFLSISCKTEDTSVNLKASFNKHNQHHLQMLLKCHKWNMQIFSIKLFFIGLRQLFNMFHHHLFKSDLLNQGHRLII